MLKQKLFHGIPKRSRRGSIQCLTPDEVVIHENSVLIPQITTFFLKERPELQRELKVVAVVEQYNRVTSRSFLLNLRMNLQAGGQWIDDIHVIAVCVQDVKKQKLGISVIQSLSLRGTVRGILGAEYEGLVGVEFGYLVRSSGTGLFAVVVQSGITGGKEFQYIYPLFPKVSYLVADEETDMVRRQS